jgi:hypothetical protein
MIKYNKKYFFRNATMSKWCRILDQDPSIQDVPFSVDDDYVRTDKVIMGVLGPIWIDETFLILGRISWNRIKEQKSKIFHQ